MSELTQRPTREMSARELTVQLGEQLAGKLAEAASPRHWAHTTAAEALARAEQVTSRAAALPARANWTRLAITPASSP